MTFSENFKNLMKKNKLTANEIADRIGVTRGTVTHWSNGIRFPKDDVTIKNLAKILRVGVEELFNGKANKIGTSERPLIGEASCGVPITYYYDDEYEMITAPEWAGERSYYVKADGDSMEPDIMNGSLVLCDPDAEVIEGKFVHYTWDGENGIKKYINLNGQVMLQPINPNHPPILVTDAYELRMVRCVFVGKVL